MPKPVTILIPTRFNTRYMIELCLNTIRKYTYYPHKVVVGDAGADPETRTFLENRRDVLLVNPPNINHPKDFLVKQVDTPYFLFLHDDIQILKNGWLEKRVALMESHSANAIVGTVVSNYIYGWREHFLYRSAMRRFWPLALLVRTDVQHELNLSWGATGNFDTGGMAYQQFCHQKRYRFVSCKFHKEIRHFSGMTWPVRKMVQNEPAGVDLNAAVSTRDAKMDHIRALLESGRY